MIKFYANTNNNGYVTSQTRNEGDVFWYEQDGWQPSKKITDDNGCYLYKVVDGKVVDTTDEDKAETLRLSKYSEIDSLYKSHIYAQYPIEKQNKYGFYFSSLLDKRLNGEELTTEEIEKAEELRSLHRWYTKQIENCNTLQTALADMSYDELKDYVPEIIE